MLTLTRTLHDGTQYVTDDGSPDTRYVVWQDDNAKNPAENWDGIAYAVYSQPHGTEPSADEYDGTMRAFLTRYDLTGDDADALVFARRYAAAYGLTESIDTFSVTGYSQGDWQEIVIVTPAESDPRSYYEEYVAWFRGSVYVVMQETLTVCDHGTEHWEPVTDQGIDSLVLGGIYADDAESAVSAYLDQA